MKKLGEWYIPDFDNPTKLKFLADGHIQCRSALERAFGYITSFRYAIDVGAWIGDSTCIIADKFEHVIAFEPVKDLSDCCRQNLIEKKILNFTLHTYGLSNKSGKQILVNKGKSFSGFIPTLKSTNLEQFKRSIEIETKTLDEFNFNNIDFIKIDVDSHEGYLLLGAKHFFQKNNPVIMIESKQRDQLKYQNLDMPNPIKFLLDLGYMIRETHGKADYILTR